MCALLLYTLGAWGWPMALTDEQRIAIIAAALDDARLGVSLDGSPRKPGTDDQTLIRDTPAPEGWTQDGDDQARSTRGAERVAKTMAGFGSRENFIHCWVTASDAAKRIASLPEPVTPEQRRGAVLSAIHDADKERQKVDIAALVQSYLEEHPGYALPSGDTHPAVLALSKPVMGWLIERVGGNESYWEALLRSARVWFSDDMDSRACRIFRARFEGEGNIFWQGNPRLEALCRDYDQWRKQTSSSSSKPRVSDV